MAPIFGSLTTTIPHLRIGAGVEQLLDNGHIPGVNSEH